MKNKQIYCELPPPCDKGLFARFFALFFCLVMGMNVWGADVENAIISSSTTDYTTVLSFTKDNSNATCEVATLSSTNCVKVAIGGTGNKSAYLTTTSSFTNIKSISLKIATSDKGKTSLAIEVSPNADFSESITTVQELALCSALPTAATTNNTFYLESYTLDPTISGYVRLRLCQPSSSGKTMYVADYTITTAAAGPVSPVCPSGLTIASKDNKTAFVEGDKIELSASLAAGNGEISYQWYKDGFDIDGATSKNLTINSCVLADAGSYTCRATKTDCAKDAVSENTLVLTVAPIDWLIQATFATSTTATVSGNPGGTADVSVSSGGKLDKGKYFGIKLANNEKFQAGDKVSLHFTTAGGTNSWYVFNSKTASDVNLIYSSNENGKSTDLTFTITSEQSAIYLVRTSDGTEPYGIWNPTLGYIKVVRPAKHDVIFAAGDGSGSMETKQVAEGANYTIPACTFTAPAGKEFDAWTSSDVTITDGKFTMPAKDVTLTATWKTSVTKYTVTYKDGETVLGSEQVVAGQKAANVPTPTKELNTFAGWEDEEHHAIDFATATINADLTAYAKWTPMGEATSIDIEQFVLDNSKKGDIKAALTAHNFDYNLTLGDSKDGLDSLASGKAASNYEYLGLKMKTNGSYVVGNIPAGKRVDVVIGNLGSAKVQINGADAAALAAGVEADSLPAHNYYDLPEGGVLKVLSTGTKTTVLKGIILGEIPAVSDDATLSAIKLDGVDIAGFAAGTGVYNVRLAYGAALPEITVTVNNEHATYTVHPATEENNYYATVRVTAEAGNTLDYQVRFTWAPKMGAEIIKATITGTTTATVDGLIGGTAEVSLSGLKDGGYKVDKGKYIGITLAAGETFNEGDVVVINSSVKGTGGKVVLFADKNKTVKVYEGTDAGQEIVYVTLPAEAEDLTSLYIVRDAKDETYKWNPVLVSFAVLRQMPSMIKSFTIGEAEGVIDQMNKTIAVSVPYGTSVTALTPEVEAYANGGATVTPTGAQNFSSAKTYTVASAYVEDGAVSYEVTVTVAEPACPTEVTISGTPTYTDGATIELTATTDGTGSVTYQWYKDEVAIIDATSATFSKTATMTDGGNYVCKVNQGSCGEVASAPYAVTVSKKAVTSIAVTSEGDVVRVKKGESLNLTAKITPEDATYPEVTWSSEGNPAYFTFADENANPAAAIASRVGSSKKVYAKADSKTGTIQLTCYVEVVYNVNGGDAIANAEYDGGTAITLPTPTGGTEPFLGWYSDAEFNTKVGNAGATYKPADNVTLYAKWTLPDAATPVFSQNIADHEYPYGTETFEALTVAASPVTSYQWYKNGAVIEGETSATYTPTTVGTYKVVAINAPVGYNPTSTNSEEAVISVAAPAGGYTQVDVTGDMIWDFSKVPVDASAITSDGIKSTEANQVMANIANVQTDRDVFFSEALVMGNNNEHAYRATNNECYQGRLLKFHTTVDGFVTIDARAASGSTTLRIGDKDFGSIGTTRKNYSAFVPAGDVEIIAGNNDPSKQTVRIFSMTFTAVTAANEVRTGLEAGRMYTYCPAQNAPAVGNADFFVPENFDGFYVNLMQVNTLTAGHGYIMIPTASTVYAVFNGEVLTEAVEASAATHGMQGFLSANPTATQAIEDSEDNIVVINNHLHYAGGNYMGVGRAYIRLDIVRELTAEPENPAPRRRIGFDSTVATDINALDQNADAQKIFRDGTIIIVRGGKMYNVNGQLLK